MPSQPKTFSLVKPKGDQPRRSYDNRRRPSAARRGYDNRWQKLRLRKLATQPICENPAKRRGCTDLATEIDHIIPFQGREDPLRLDWGNLQSLCKSCHSSKTRIEQNDGRGKGGQISTT